MSIKLAVYSDSHGLTWFTDGRAATYCSTYSGPWCRCSVCGKKKKNGFHPVSGQRLFVCTDHWDKDSRPDVVISTENVATIKTD